MGWAEEVLADLPVGWWPCNEGTGAPLDESGHGFATTLSAGAGPRTTDAPPGHAPAAGAGVRASGSSSTALSTAPRLPRSPLPSSSNTAATRSM